jgi:O-antigen ligase
MLAWLAFPALLPALFKKEPSAKKHYLLGLIACAAVVLAAIALSGERMALLLTLLGIAMACVLLRLRLRIIALGAAFIAGLLVVLAFASPDMLERQVSSTIQTLTHWQESPYGLLLTSDMTLAKQHPIFGMGAGNFRSGCEALYIGDQESATRITQMCNTHPHNIYLEWLIEEGIIGFALFVIFIGLVIKNCVCVFIRQPVNLAFSGLFIAFILRLWPLMATTGFFSRWGAPPFWLVLGGLLVYTAGKGVKNAGASLSLQDTRL